MPVARGVEEFTVGNFVLLSSCIPVYFQFAILLLQGHGGGEEYGFP